MTRYSLLFSVLAGTFLMPVAAMADDVPHTDKAPHVEENAMVHDAPGYEHHALGDLGGLRQRMDELGIDLTVDYKADFWRVARGGINPGNSYVDNLDVRVEVDGGKLFGSEGTRIVVHGINNMGSQVNLRRIGGIQGSDNMEVTYNTAQLYEAYVEQNFGSRDQYSVLVGLKELNEEFNITEISNNFIAPTFQLGQELAASGVYGPSTFPVTALSGRVQYKPTEESYIRAAVFEGTPGDPDRRNGTHMTLGDGEGVLLISEVGIKPAFPGQTNPEFNLFALGGWMYTSKFDDLTDTDSFGNPVQSTNRGMYGLASLEFYRDPVSNKMVGGFTRVGIADQDTHQTDFAYELGVVGQGWVPTRPESEIGAGVSYASNGNKFIQAAIANGDNPSSGEAVWELYYKDVIANGVSIQPDLQYVTSPGANADIDNAVVLGMRLDVNL